MKKILSAFIAVALVAFLVYGVFYNKKEVPVEGPGKVTVTAAFAELYGQPPQPDKGDAYAFLVYFPSSQEPGKVVGLPFFSFDRQSLKKVALQKLATGLDLRALTDVAASPFPSATRVIEASEAGGTLTVTMSAEAAASDEKSLVALEATAAQFPEVRKIVVKAGDKQIMEKTLTASAYKDKVIDPGQPRILSVTAMKDKGEKEVHEVDVFFDRPVSVTHLSLADKAGASLEGDIYHSVFDMAAVLKPAKKSAAFTAGLPVVVTWDVVDKKGRKSAGTKEFALEIKEH